MLVFILSSPDVNECEDNPCQAQANAQCNNLVGSYECVCQEGYVFNENKECIRKSLLTMHYNTGSYSALYILILHLQLCVTHLVKTEGLVLVQVLAAVYLVTQVRNLWDRVHSCVMIGSTVTLNFKIIPTNTL